MLLLLSMLVMLGTLLAAAFALVAASAATGRAGNLHPDLGVSRLDQVFLVQTPEGRKELRFTTRIVNVGAGPMEIVAARKNVTSAFSVWQRVRTAEGSWARIETPDVRLTYVGSTEHGHWHVKGAARYRLRRIDSGRTVATGVKAGFCYFDDVVYRRLLVGAPVKPVYARSGCGKRADLKLTTGISVGWLDSYYWRIPGQQIDITGLPAGRYRLSVTADPENWFRESSERNNTTWVELRIAPTGVTVLRHGPRP